MLPSHRPVSGPQRLRLAVGGAAVVAVVALVACGSTGSPSGTSHPSTPSGHAPRATAPAKPATAFNTADAAFATGMLRLAAQAQATAGLAAGHTTSAQLHQFAAGVSSHVSDAEHMRALMGQWHQSAPAPYTQGAVPPAGAGPGMMSSHDWQEMTSQSGHEFDEHWLDVMMANRAAEIALCRAEIGSGASPQARAQAQSLLTTRQAELTQLQQAHHQQEHAGDHDADHD